MTAAKAVGLDDIGQARLHLEKMRLEVGPAPFSGRVVESDWLVDRTEDWSKVRSPSRAARRRRQGHRQRIRIVEVPRREVLVIDGVMYAHPVVVAEIRAQVQARSRELERSIDRMALDTLMSRPRL